MDRVSFDNMLGTYYAPSYNERCTIKSLVEKELSSLNEFLLPLLAKRDKLNGSIAAHMALLAPARRVLPELVSEIFTHATHSKNSEPDRHRSLLPRPRASEAPLKLGRICRHWRQIALSTPMLWSAVEIPKTWMVAGLQEWIQRAGTLTLSFDVEIHQRNFEVLKLLASYQKRWKEVVLRFDASRDGPQLVKEFLDSLSSRYENLQNLRIDSAPPAWEDPVTNTELTLGIFSAPNLNCLFLNAPNFKINTPNAMAFPHMREINVDTDWHPITAADFLNLLRLSPAVEVVAAYVMPITVSGDAGCNMLTLTNLKDLEIWECHQITDGFGLLERLDLPALKRLSFHKMGNSGRSAPFHEIRSLVHRSRPPLTALKARGVYVPAADLIYCIPLLPHLSCLDIEHVNAGETWNGVLRSLTGPIPPSDENLSGCMCAELNETRFGPDNDADPELVIKMILSRSAVGSNKLSHVAILSCSEGDVLANPKIIDCVANGLEFTGNRWRNQPGS